jgi:hypothetical protein
MGASTKVDITLPADPEQKPLYIKRPDGSVRAMSDKEDIKEAIRTGAPVVDEEGARRAYGSEQERQRALEMSGPMRFGLGAGQGLTLGAAGPVMAGIGGMIDPALGESIRGDFRGMEGDTAYQAGDIFGMGLGALATGGEGLLGGVAERFAVRALPSATSALGRIGTRAAGLAARGATEGAILGASQAASQAIIHNAPLTAETMLSGAAEGALLGVAVGSFAGVGTGIASESFQALRRFASAAPVGQASGKVPGAVLRHIGATGEDMAQMEARGGITKSLKAFHDEALAPAGKNWRQPTSALRQEATELVKRSAQVIDDVGATLQTQAPGMAPSKSRMLAAIKEVAVEPYRGTLEYQKAIQAHTNMAKAMPDTGDWQKVIQSRGQLAESLGGGTKFNQDFRMKVLNVYDAELNAAAESAGASIGKPGIADQLKAAQASKVMAEHFQEMTTKASFGETLADKQRIHPMEWGAASAMGASGRPMVGGGYLGAKYIGRWAEEKITPWLAQRSYEMSVGAKAAASVPTAKQKIRQGIGKFLGGGSVAAARVTSKVGSRRDFEKQVETTSVLTSPQHKANVERYAKAMEGAGQAELAKYTMEAYLRATAYLQHNMPTGSIGIAGAMSLRGNPQRDGLSAKEWKFMAIDAAIKNPLSLMDKLASGEVSRDEVRAVKYVYPNLHAEMVSLATEEVFLAKQKGKYLDYERIQLLGTALDAPIDFFQEPQNTAEVQQALAMPEPEGPKPSRPQTSTPTDLLTPIDKAILQ